MTLFNSHHQGSFSFLATNKHTIHINQNIFKKINKKWRNPNQKYSCQNLNCRHPFLQTRKSEEIGINWENRRTQHTRTGQVPWKEHSMANERERERERKRERERERERRRNTKLTPTYLIPSFTVIPARSTSTPYKGPSNIKEVNSSWTTHNHTWNNNTYIHAHTHACDQCVCPHCSAAPVSNTNTRVKKRERESNVAGNPMCVPFRSSREEKITMLSSLTVAPTFELSPRHER